jgi:ATP phosphoribosyltransferase regulatory subunit HisZ
VLHALRDGDHVGAFGRARDGGMSEAAIARARTALAARGTEIESVDAQGIDELREVINLARELFAGEAPWGVPNLALVPALPYYTGVVFEALHPDVGFPIAAGGRYDLLLAAFGAARPATGFAINVPRLHLALFHSGWRPGSERPLVALAPGEAVATARVAAKLRAAGLHVAIGSVAEPAGLQVVNAEVIDDAHVRVDGKSYAADALANRLA